MQRRKLLESFINGYVNSKRLPLKAWQDFCAKAQWEEFLQGGVLERSSQPALPGQAFLRSSFITALCKVPPRLSKTEVKEFSPWSSWCWKLRYGEMTEVILQCFAVKLERSLLLRLKKGWLKAGSKQEIFFKIKWNKNPYQLPCWTSSGVKNLVRVRQGCREHEEELCQPWPPRGSPEPTPHLQQAGWDGHSLFGKRTSWILPVLRCTTGTDVELGPSLSVIYLYLAVTFLCGLWCWERLQ